MDPVRQAEVFFTQPNALDDMLVSHVRSAAASVVGLVPMLRDVRIDFCEDDLSALVRELLAARLEMYKWSVGAEGSPGLFLAPEFPDVGVS
jgi:hypothetical protein